MKLNQPWLIEKPFRTFVLFVLLSIVEMLFESVVVPVLHYGALHCFSE